MQRFQKHQGRKILLDAIENVRGFKMAQSSTVKYSKAHQVSFDHRVVFAHSASTVTRIFRSIDLHLKLKFTRQPHETCIARHG
jgi:hypothetical protein